MRIQIHPSMQWGAVFQVPAVVVDQHLKLASPEQLRVLLWVMRHASELPDAEDIAAALRYSASNTIEYLTFWQQKGVLLLEGEPPASPASSVQPSVPPQQAEPAQQTADNPAPKPLEDLPQIKPSMEQIEQRLTEEPNLEFLFNEAQKKFGRTIGYEGQCTLLMMYDHYGLPIEVILMIIEYCTEVRKTANSYIAAMAKNWAQEEIDTIEKAEEKINMLHRCNKLWKELAAAAGLSAPNPTAVQSEFLRTWSGELGFDLDMILLAYEEMANHCTRLSFAYMNKVLHNWFDKGIRTPQQAAEYNRQYMEKRKKTSDTDAQPPASYDIEEMERKLLYGPIVYKDKQ